MMNLENKTLMEAVKEFIIEEMEERQEELYNVEFSELAGELMQYSYMDGYVMNMMNAVVYDFIINNIDEFSDVYDGLDDYIKKDFNIFGGFSNVHKINIIAVDYIINKLINDFNKNDKLVKNYYNSFINYLQA